jgi:hypothetical protein
MTPMKTSSLTQALKTFLAGILHSDRKAKNALTKVQKAKKRPYTIAEDQKFRNVTE